MVSSAWQTVMTGLMMILIVLPGSPVQTQPNEAGACHRAYGSIPSTDTLPEWLQTDISEESLHTENRYDLLAGHLLVSGIVDGSQCFGWGMNTDGSPNGCGVEVAQSSVIEWQNQYDEAIVDTSKRNGLPARLIKSMIAVETQFWPGSDWMKGEIGLGQLTEAGADMMLTWRTGVYQNTCSQVYGDETCQHSYVDQEPWIQAALRGKLLQMLDTTCPSCKGGVDPERGSQTIPLLAEGISASCQQTAYLVRRFSGLVPSDAMGYEDFMRLVMANYHAGAGCTIQALRNSPLEHDWNNLALDYPFICQNGPGYIRRIMELMQP